MFEGVSQITVVEPQWVVEIDEFALFPMLYLRKVQN